MTEAEVVERPKDVELVTASAPRKDIIESLRTSCAFFFEFFIGEELTTEVPVFQVDIWGRLIDSSKERNTLAIPRGHNKTTMAKLAVIWHWLFTPHRFCIYVSSTNNIALNACKDIVEYLKSDNFTAVFGAVRVVKESESHSLWMYDIKDASGKTKRVILRALGANQQVRGINVDNRRPDLAVVDDVEDNDVVNSKALQKKLDLWVYGPFIKCLARTNKRIIWLGNMLSKTSMLARITRDPIWNPVVYGAIVRDVLTKKLKPLWPAMWTMEQLLADFLEAKKMDVQETWLCEMMNMPGNMKNGFTADSINYEPLPPSDDLECAFITIDPAFGTKSFNDSTAVVVHGITKSGMPMVLDHRVGKFTESEIFENALELARDWNAWTWGVESVAAQRVLVPLFKLLEVGKFLNHDIEYVFLMAGNKEPKVSRIRAWISMMAAKEYAIPEDDFDITSQILSYDVTNKDNVDDLIDSCAYGPQMIEEYYDVIYSKAQELESVAAPVGIYGRKVANV